MRCLAVFAAVVLCERSIFHRFSIMYTFLSYLCRLVCFSVVPGHFDPRRVLCSLSCVLVDFPIDLALCIRFC
jgi:hypothetical protein